ncbi:MAG: triose-phosphate isomerase [Burkholderiales bacterium]
MRDRLVAGNWKMHGNRSANRALLASVLAGLGTLRGVDCAICVPFPYLAEVGAQLQDSALALGAQNLSEHEQGAYTGEVSAAMLADLGCRYVIVGHSERRQLYGENDAVAAAKFKAAQAQRMTPILCVGETLAEREADRTQAVVARQLDAVIALNGKDSLKQAVVAYEPVWAIGTGRTATPQQAQAVHAFLRARLPGETRLLYGGSVKKDNAAQLFAQPDVDGGLIGGASLVAAEFLAIASAACRRN